MGDKTEDLYRDINKKEIIAYLQNRISNYNLKYDSPFKIYTHMLFASLKGIKYFFRNKHRKNHEELKILFNLEGGLGDVIIDLNFICHFYNHFVSNKKIIIDVHAANKRILQEFAPNFINIQDKIKPNNYDLRISIMRCPNIIYANIDSIKEFSNDLLNFVKKYIELYKENDLFIDISPYRDSITNNIFSSSKKRWHQPDVIDFFDIKEKFILPVNVPDMSSLKKKFDIKDKFITISREVGHENLIESTKLWPLKNYKELVEKIKNNFPDYQIIEVGSGKGPRIGNTHLNLAGKTSLKEIKILMKYSLLHIDSEGGLIHLRHLLQGGKSIVIFGPTSPNVYGYSENVNICSNACPIHCEFYYMNWQKKCRLDNTHICMQSISVDKVFQEVKNQL